jgi:hypothetical protein
VKLGGMFPAELAREINDLAFKVIQRPVDQANEVGELIDPGVLNVFAGFYHDRGLDVLDRKV